MFSCHSFHLLSLHFFLLRGGFRERFPGAVDETKDLGAKAKIPHVLCVDRFFKHGPKKRPENGCGKLRKMNWEIMMSHNSSSFSTTFHGHVQSSNHFIDMFHFLTRV